MSKRFTTILIVGQMLINLAIVVALWVGFTWQAKATDILFNNGLL